MHDRQLVELGDDRVVGDGEGGVLVALVGERTAGQLVVAGHLLGSVIDVPGGDDLVTRMVERRHRDVEVVGVLRRHVLAHDRKAPLAQVGWGRWP